MVTRSLACGLVTIAVASGCGTGNEPEGSSEVCGRQGHPVTVERLVEAFERNGLSVEVNQGSCERPGGARPDATNFGATGLTRDPEISDEEGDILCYLGSATDPREGSKVRREHFDGEEETTLYVLNVGCSVYPSDATSAEQQIGRVARVLTYLVDHP